MANEKSWIVNNAATDFIGQEIQAYLRLRMDRMQAFIKV